MKITNIFSSTKLARKTSLSKSIALILSSSPSLAFAYTDQPDLQLATEFHFEKAKLNASVKDKSLENYWISEKLDGVRAHWNGKQLISRGGHVINAPQWFTRDFPSQPMDGELWIARQKFSEISGIARTKQPVDSEWKKVKFMAFDLVNKTDSFETRKDKLSDIIEKSNLPHLQAVAQFRIRSSIDLKSELIKVTANGGEGLMMHQATAKYTSGRSSQLKKVKMRHDAEATVIGYTEGKGQFKGKLGSLIVETENGKQFKIGTGFSANERANPPKIGSSVTFQYSGLTKNGLPRFASFLRIREE